MIKERPIKHAFIHKKNRVYLLSDVIVQIGELLQLDPYDLYNSSNHFNHWCDQNGYGQFDSENKKRSQSNIWFAEYKKDKKGESDCPPYLSIIDIFVDEHPELFPLNYVDDLRGKEVCFDMDYLIFTIKSNKKYQQDIEGLLVKCLEKIQNIYGNQVYFCEQEA